MHDDHRLVIGGDRVAGADVTDEIIDPATEKVIAHAPQASADQAAGAVTAARDDRPLMAVVRPAAPTG